MAEVKWIKITTTMFDDEKNKADREDARRHKHTFNMD